MITLRYSNTKQLAMNEKKSNNFSIPFKDCDLPINDLSIKRIEEIEQVVIPRL
jgi:hypothetical protein